MQSFAHFVQSAANIWKNWSKFSFGKLDVSNSHLGKYSSLKANAAPIRSLNSNSFTWYQGPMKLEVVKSCVVFDSFKKFHSMTQSLATTNVTWSTIQQKCIRQRWFELPHLLFIRKNFSDRSFVPASIRLKAINFSYSLQLNSFLFLYCSVFNVKLTRAANQAKPETHKKTFCVHLISFNSPSTMLKLFSLRIPFGRWIQQFFRKHQTCTIFRANMEDFLEKI